ncbi:MAG TPA: hypothetical protein VGL99_29775 [Chloroflexota bacterium]
MTFGQSLSFARRWRWLVLLGIVVAAGATYVVSEQMPRVYEARATVLVSNTDLSSNLTADQLTATYAELITAGPIVASVASAMGSPVEEVDAALDTTPIRDTRFIQLRARSTDPARAADIANRVAATAAQQLQAARAERAAARIDRVRAVVDQLGQDVADRAAQVRTLQGTSPSPQRDVQLSIALNDLARTQQRLTTAMNALEEARVAQAGAGEVLTLPEPAAVPTQAVLPRVAINVFSAAVVGLLVAVLIGLVLDLLFDRRAPLADLAGAAGVATVVGETGRGSVVVTGANPSANSASAAIDLAMARARAGNRVILVDANLYQPRLSELLALDARRGLTNLLSNPARPARAELQASNVEQLGVLCAGPVTSNAIDLLDSERMRTIVDELRDGVDVVIVAAPSLDTSGAIALLSTGSDVVLAGVAPRA